jgi:aryl-alcohol dehydrogenase-like predicted oxidoreductase
MISTQPFGRTGQDSTRIIFGAAALGEVSQDDADRTLETLLRHGINHIDVAASYGDAELRIGPWMERHRDRFFLATKTGERSYERAMSEIQRSLERLRTDRVDLIQLHNLVDPIEWQQALSHGGALEAAIEARRQGMVRFIGVTGHGTPIAATHIRSLERFEFDSVLLPYSYVVMQNAKYAADFEALMAICAERDVAVQTIKSIARRPWGDAERSYTTWYEPMDDQVDIDPAVHWVLNRPGIFLNTVSDIGLLAKVLNAAERFEPAPSRQPLEEALAKLELEPLFV